jgi:choice-of-anchor C domain-containing protein
VIRALKASLVLALLSICAFAAGRPAAAQNLVVNGSFENGATISGGFRTVGAGDTSITGWTITSGSVDYIGSFWQAQDGVRSIDLSGDGPGTLAQQTIATQIGQTYLIEFWMAGNPDDAPSLKELVASFGTNQVFSFQTTPFVTTRNNMLWEYRSFYTTATNTSTDLWFQSLNDSPYGPALDNVSVQAVPEPGEYAVMGMATLALGGLMYRARRRSGARTLGT